MGLSTVQQQPGTEGWSVRNHRKVSGLRGRATDCAAHKSDIGICRSYKYSHIHDPAPKWHETNAYTLTYLVSAGAPVTPVYARSTLIPLLPLSHLQTLLQLLWYFTKKVTFITIYYTCLAMCHGSTPTPAPTCRPFCSSSL